ncbi:MAG: molybdopterin-dependent oxidoreductase [Coriobacteriales bacterium]|nr:molybdopterin-dependent oxidoreductase [Coriobacteriales bacterium]
MAMSREWRRENPDGSVTVRSCCWSPPGDHPVGCGLLLTVKDGKLINVEGDEEHSITNGRLCIRALSLPEIVHSPERILYPMKRDPKDRGKDAWTRISWDETFDLVCGKVNYFKDEYGAQSILVFGGTGREACIYYYPLGFSTLQTPNVCYGQSGWSCYGPRCSITDYILGAGYPEIDFAGYFEDRYNNPEFELPKYVVCWGKMPLASNGDGLFGHALIDMMRLGTKIIMIDPRITWLGAIEGNINLQIKPGSDAAVGLGLANVIIEEGLQDQEWIDAWCYGWDEFVERAKEYPPERVEELAWCSAEQLRKVARCMAEKPVSIAWGLAVDQNPNGSQVGHITIILQAITGNIDIPGGLTLGPPSALLGKWRMETRKDLAPDLWDMRLGAAEYPALSNAMATTHPDFTLDVLETGKPYEIKMCWFNSSNLLAPTCSAAPTRWHDALIKTEFNVVQDLFMTPTAMACADVFLPLPTVAEHDGVVITHYGRNTVFLGAMNEALRLGETKSDIEVCIEFGKRLNNAGPDGSSTWNVFEGDTRDQFVPDFFTKQLEPELGFDFDELRRIGFYQPGYTYRKYEKGMLRFDGEPGFNTVTGMVELYSTLFDAWGEDPLPYYEEPRWSPVSHPELAERYPLMMTTGSREYSSFHSEHRQIPTLRHFRTYPDIEIHPDVAAQYGIEEGDWVEVENPFGRARQKAHLVITIDPRVVHCRHGWWYPEQDGEEPNLFGTWKSNVNTLVPHFDIGRLGFGAPFKSVFCSIKKVDDLDSIVPKRSYDIVKEQDRLAEVEGVDPANIVDIHREHRIY